MRPLNRLHNQPHAGEQRISFVDGEKLHNDLWQACSQYAYHSAAIEAVFYLFDRRGATCSSLPARSRLRTGRERESRRGAKRRREVSPFAVAAETKAVSRAMARTSYTASLHFIA